MQRDGNVKENWAGRVFVCNDTGEKFTIPDDVKPKDFFVIGNGFIDVGDGYYCRWGGNIEEVRSEP